MSEEERLVAAAAARGDEDETDRSLRPRQLDEFVGQEVVREQLSIALAAAKERGEPIDHVLLAGPPGLGKSTLAHIVASEMDARLITVSGPGLDRKGDLVAILADLAERDVVFIDEVHRLNRSVEETLYPAMEDGVVDIIMGQGPGARSLRLDLAPFTLIGATTRASLLTKPLRDRFGIVFRLDHYSPAELVRIAQRSAGILGIQMQDDAAAELAQRARGTPRLANRLLRRVRDFAQVRGDGAIDHATAVAALDLLGVDAEGLDRLDRELLRMIAETFEGGPVGLSTLADAIGEDRGTIEDVYEPYLLQKGLLQRTPRGRVITRIGRAPSGTRTRRRRTTTACSASRRALLRGGDGRQARAARGLGGAVGRRRARRGGDGGAQRGRLRRGMPAAAGAEREDDGGRGCGRRREGEHRDAHGAVARGAPRAGSRRARPPAAQRGACQRPRAAAPGRGRAPRARRPRPGAAARGRRHAPRCPAGGGALREPALGPPRATAPRASRVPPSRRWPQRPPRSSSRSARAAAGIPPPRRPRCAPPSHPRRPRLRPTARRSPRAA